MSSAKPDDSLLLDIATRVFAERPDPEAILRAKEREQLREQILGPIVGAGFMVEPDARTALADRAIALVMDKQYRFHAPATGALQDAYVRRAHLGRRYGIPALAAAALGVLAWGGSVLYQEQRLNAQEREVETTLEESQRELVALRGKLDTMQRDWVIPKMPPQNRSSFYEHAQSARRSGDDAESILAQYVRDGSAQATVTRENFASVRPRAEQARGRISEARQKAAGAQNLVRNEHELIDVRSMIDRTFAEIRSISEKPAPLARLAETHYAHGIASVEQRNLGESKENLTHLQDLRKDITVYQQSRAAMTQYLNGIEASKFASPVIRERARSLHATGMAGLEQYRLAEARGASENLEALHTRVSRTGELAPLALGSYESATRIVRDWRAQQELQHHYAAAQDAINVADTGKLEQATVMLEDLNNKLSATRLIILKGRERDYVSKYLILRAEDPSGQARRLRVRNREKESYEFVTEWGKLVDEDIYNAVGADWSPDHIIDDNVYATKQQGYLDWQIRPKFQGSKAGLPRSECSDCITQW